MNCNDDDLFGERKAAQMALENGKMK